MNDTLGENIALEPGMYSVYRASNCQNKAVMPFAR